jgi:signal transduction histidine kinase/DNA-binding response OmpR family regulator
VPIDLLLSIALDAAFFAVLGFTLLEYLRRGGRVRLLVVLVFASVGVVIAATPIRALVPAAGPLLTLVSIPALLAQPVLVLWLSSLMRPAPRAVVPAAWVAFVVVSALLFAVVATGTTGSGTGSLPPSPFRSTVLVALLAYFFVLETLAAVWFVLAARERSGASRARLITAAAGTALFGAALVLTIAGGIVNAPGSSGADATRLLGRLVALLSALAYLAAFAPPRALRRLSQQSIVYDYIRELNALPSGARVDAIWHLIERTAARASGAVRTAIVMAPSAEPLGAGSQRVDVAFHSERWPTARLELDLRANALFVEDDIELIGVVVDRGVRAAEREQFLVEREQLITDLQAASAAKSDFLAAMSHELRTPLNAIIGFSELLAEGGDESASAQTVASYSDHIHASGLHLLELVNDVLDLARVEAGRLDLKPVRFDLDALVRQTVANVQPLADQKRQTVTLQLAPVAVDADPSRIRQVVLNLLSNAIKFTADEGAIRLSLRADGDDAELTVADTGSGIAAADLDRIFEAFQQGEGQERVARHEGTGLGLALTRQLVEAHGGRVEVRSQVGVGSEFTVRLPLYRRHVEVADRPPVVSTGQPTVLVIEDDPAARELLRHYLEGAGYAVLPATTGRQGLAWVHEARPDAVLLDILLPDIDGWEILERLKSDATTRSIPVMVVSVVDDRELGLALGAVDYFVKPISREPLLEALGRLTFTSKVRTRTVTALIIDADPEAPERYRMALEPDGFRVIVAPDGATGRQRAVADRPDLIMLDSTLPDIDGFELAAALRRDPSTASIPIWLTTPEGLSPEARARLNVNVQAVLERGDDALAALQRWLVAGHVPTPPAASPARSVKSR